MEYLTQLDQLLVKQKVEVLEVVTGFETQNKYKVKNALGQDVFKAKEDSNFCARYCLGPARPFKMHIIDYRGVEVIRLDRPYRCSSCCCFCCLQELEVMSPVTNERLGSVKQACSLFTPNYEIYDEQENHVFNVTGPCCQIKCCSDIVFPITDADDNEVGRITKQWSGMGKEMLLMQIILE